MKKLNHNKQYLFLFILSLEPLLWYLGKGNVVINGLDTNFPLNPLVWWQKRLFVWDSAINAGVDHSSSLSGIFFHFIQVVPYVLGFSLQLTQILNVIFWFGLIIFSSYLFSIKFISKNYYVNILFVILYSFNIYLYNTWENIKVANLALYAGIPLFLTILRLSEKKLTQTLIIATVFASIITLGVGINPAYFLALFGAMCAYIASNIFLNYKNEKLKKILLNYSQIIIVFIAVNLFWIFPLVNNLVFTSSIKSISDFGYSNWVDSLSQNTSLFNVIRLQGLWDWYVFDQSGTPLHIPYAQTYFKNPLFIFYSYLIPLAALTSYAFMSKKKIQSFLFFSLLLVIGLFMGMGTHPPSGVIFKFLSAKVPFMSFFRSPFYIFGPYIAISVAALVALLFDNIFNKYKEYTKIINGLIIFIIFVHLSYSYPMLTGDIFRPNRQDTYYVNYPQHVYDTQEWLATTDYIEDRVAIYPDDSLEVFEWGHSNVGSILGLMSDKEFISTSFHSSNQNLNEIILQFYSYLKRNKYQTAEKLMPYMAADTLMVKNDAKSHVPDLDNNHLDKLFEKESLGPWDFYKTNLDVNKIYIAKNIYLNTSNENIIDEVAPLLKDKSVLLNANDTEVQKAFQQGGIELSLVYKASKPDNKTYILEVVKEGKYKLVFKKDGYEGDYTITSEEINFNNLEKESTEEFIIYNIENLQKGNYTITVDYPESENIIAISDYSKLSNVLGLNSSQLPTEENVLVASNIERNNQFYTLPLNGFNPLSKYEISMEYKYLSGIPPTMLLTQKAGDQVIQAMPFNLQALPTWSPLSLQLDPNDYVSELTFEYAIPAGKQYGTSVSYFKNITMKEVYNNQIYLIEEREEFNDINSLNYIKVNPVTYNVEIDELSGPSILVFLENYSSNWQLSTSDQVHFSANGYANAWFIGQKGEYRITYTNQRYMILGYVLGITILAGVYFGNLYLVNKQKIKS